MAMSNAASARRRPDATRAALLDAARLEFEEAGFDATNTNKIAARAGYAPQTFYRHFADKLDIFLAVYRAWTVAELQLLDGVRDADAAADVVIKHHKASLNFRRALRLLSLTDTRIRAARAESRKLQVARLRERLPHLSERKFSELVTSLLLLERITDACAEGEFADVGVKAAEATQLVAALIRKEFGKRRDR